MNAGSVKSIVMDADGIERSLTRIATEELRELMRYDEMELETLGDAGQKQAIFGIVSDNDPTYRFLFGILNYITIRALEIFMLTGVLSVSRNTYKAAHTCHPNIIPVCTFCSL